MATTVPLKVSVLIVALPGMLVLVVEGIWAFATTVKVRNAMPNSKRIRRIVVVIFLLSLFLESSVLETELQLPVIALFRR